MIQFHLAFALSNKPLSHIIRKGFGSNHSTMYFYTFLCPEFQAKWEEGQSLRQTPSHSNTGMVLR